MFISQIWQTKQILQLNDLREIQFNLMKSIIYQSII